MKFTAIKNIHHQTHGATPREYRIARGTVVELDEKDPDVQELVAAHALQPPDGASVPLPAYHVARQKARAARRAERASLGSTKAAAVVELDEKPKAKK